MEETNKLDSKQFIADKNLGECMREMKAVMEKNQLRPLEREIVLLLLYDRLLTEKQMAKSAGLLQYGMMNMTNLIGKGRRD